MPLVISSWTETSNTRLSYPNTLHPSLSEAFSASLESGPYREEKAGKWRGQAEERTFSSYTADLRDRRELDPVGGHLQVPSPSPWSLVFWKENVSPGMRRGERTVLEKTFNFVACPISYLALPIRPPSPLSQTCNANVVLEECPTPSSYSTITSECDFVWK